MNIGRFRGEQRSSLRQPGLFAAGAGLIFWLKSLHYSVMIGVSSPIMFIYQQLGTLGIVLTLVAPLFLLARRGRWLYFLLTDLFLSVVILLDSIFYRHFQDIITWRALPTAWHYLGNETHWWLLLRLNDALLVLDFVVFAFVFYFAARQRRVGRQSGRERGRFNVTGSLPKQAEPDTSGEVLYPKMRKVVAFVVLAGVGFLGAFSSFRLLEQGQPGITRTLYSKVYIAQSCGELEFHALDLARLARIQTETPPARRPDPQELAGWLQQNHASLALNGSKTVGVARGMNVIVIQVESMPEFVIGSKVNGQEVTPNLNRLRESSYYFDHYFEEIGLGGTSDAEFLSNVSLYPVSHGNAYMDYPMNHYVSLAGVLKGQGYQTVAMEADQPGFWNIDLMFRAEGFQKILDEDDFRHDLDIGMGLADVSMFRQGADYLEHLKQPFYSFQVTLSSHYPFKIPKDKLGIDVGNLRGTEVGDYLESINYTDRAIGDFIKRLQDDGLWQNSVLAIYGDHHAPFQRDNAQLMQYLGYQGKQIDSFHWLALHKIPLFVHVPQAGYLGLKSITGGQLDLTPTLLGLLGMDGTRYPFAGRDLLNSSKGLAVTHSGMIVDDHAIYDIYQKKAYDLYSGKKIPWDPANGIEQVYQENVGNNDLVMRFDLQNSLGQALRSPKSGSVQPAGST